MTVADPAESPSRGLTGAYDAAWLQDELAARLSRSRHDVRLSVRGPIAMTRRSKIFRVAGDAYAAPVAVKICFDPHTGAQSRAAAETYFRTLERWSREARRDPAFRIAQPIELIADIGAVVLEWVSGPSLTQFVAHSDFAAASAVMRQAGAWLACLHLSEGASPRPLEVEAMLAESDELVAETREAGALCAMQDALRRLRATAPAAAGETTGWGPVHGDFKPNNFIVSGSAVVGIDVNSDERGPAVKDAAHFLNHLALDLYVPPALRHLPRQAKLVESFCGGYEQPGGHLPAVILSWTRLHNAVRIFATHRDWSRPPKSWFTRHCLRRLIRQLGRELEPRAAGG